MPAMLRYPVSFRLLAVVGLMCASSVSAETLCTRIIRAPEYPIPMDEREGDRQVQGHVLPGFVAEGDRLAGEGKLAEAVAAYSKVFSGFQYRGVYFGDGRCLSKDFYQTAADKLRAVASELAERRTAKGYLLDESHSYGGEFQRGALRLYLTSNQYDKFVEQAIAYAASELRDRDIDRALVSLVDNRLVELKRMREAGTEPHNRQYDNDLTPLLDEELSAFDALGEFEEKLLAHLKPLYPRITDYWLAEEGQYHQQLLATDGLIAQMMLHDKARNSLEDGIDRLADHPAEVARLQARANERGQAFMTAGRFEPAEAYFDAAGNEAERARAARLAERQGDELNRKLVQDVEADVRKMQKSEDEKAAFEQETEDMAAEFGFDLDE